MSFLAGCTLCVLRLIVVCSCVYCVVINNYTYKISGGKLPEAFGVQLFPTLVNAEDDYTARCCKALEKLLEFTPVEVIIGQVRFYPSPITFYSSLLVLSLYLYWVSTFIEVLSKFLI